MPKNTLSKTIEIDSLLAGMFAHPAIPFVGVTGTREGMSQYQEDAVRFILNNLCILGALRHGDCIGVDVQIAEIEKQLGGWTIAHPPIVNKYRGFHKSTLIMEPKPFMVRDKDIVDGVDLMIACPKQNYEIVRSGTWATIRYARKKHVPTILLLGEKCYTSA
jgi:hypothetical protein